MTEWKTYRLGDIASFSQGIQVDIDKQLPYKKGGYVRFIRIVDFTKANEPYRYIETPKKQYLTNSGDIVMIRYGSQTAGLVVKSFEGAIANNMFKITLDEQVVDRDFIYYALSQEDIFSSLRNAQSSSTMPAITFEIASRIQLKIPSLEEQRRIAGILGAIDDKIENNRRINDNLEQQAQALYKQWFVDNRNDDWETLTLDDVAAISAGGDKPQVCSEQKTQECNIPIYSNSIDREGLYGYTNNPRIIENSITISARGTIGYVCLRTEPYVPIVRLISIIPTHDNMSAYFLYLWALTQNISGTGTTQQQLTVPAFRTTKIVVPAQKALIKFNQVVKPIFDNIKQNKKENETLATLRDTLLPKLMNGEIITK